MAEELVYNSIHTGVEIDEGISKTQQIVNPNLLDNWCFVNPVNQRGQTTYTGLAYSIDRWRVNYNTTLTVSNGFVTLAGNWNAWEEREKVLPTQVITLSALVRNRKGTDAFSIFYRNPSGGELTVATYSGNDSEWVLVSGTVYTSDCKGFGFGFSGAADNFIEILAAKLELGSHQTLAHEENGEWVLNEIPDYGEQLRSCQRYYNEYYKSVSMLYCYMDGYVDGFVFPIEMAKAPALTTCTLRKNMESTDVAATAYNISNKGVEILSVPGAKNGDKYRVIKIVADANL